MTFDQMIAERQKILKLHGMTNRLKGHVERIHAFKEEMNINYPDTMKADMAMFYTEIRDDLIALVGTMPP